MYLLYTACSGMSIVLEYIYYDCNATQATFRAGYSPKTVYAIGCENLNKPELKAYIEEQIAANMEICRDTFIQWKKKYSDTLKRGKEFVDFQVVKT